MPQDPFERVQVFLSETRVNPLALLLDLTTLLPESLLQRAIWLAQHASEDVLRAFLVHALAKRLPTRVDRIELTKQYPVPSGIVIKEVSIPEGKQAKRLIAKLSEEQRYEVFDQLLVTAEIETGAIEEAAVEPSPDETFRINPGGVASADPPDNMGGGGFSFSGGGGFESVGGAESESDDAGGFEAVDDGFESMPTAAEPPPSPSPQPATPTTTDETSERPDVVNLGFSNKDAADTRLKKH